MEQIKLSTAAIITLAAVSPLAHDFSKHLKLFIIVALYDQHHILPHHEVGILVLIGVVAHTDHAVGQVAEHAAAILTGDDREASATYRMALLRSKEGIGLYLLDGDDQFILLRIIDLDDAIDKMMACLNYQGKGHSCGIHTNDVEDVNKLAAVAPVQCHVRSTLQGSAGDPPP
mgnify:CR=1 FL=1